MQRLKIRMWKIPTNSCCHMLITKNGCRSFSSLLRLYLRIQPWGRQSLAASTEIAEEAGCLHGAVSSFPAMENWVEGKGVVGEKLKSLEKLLTRVRKIQFFSSCLVSKAPFWMKINSAYSLEIKVPVWRKSGEAQIACCQSSLTFWSHSQCSHLSGNSRTLHVYQWHAVWRWFNFPMGQP